MKMSKIKFSANVAVHEAQSAGRDRFFFAIGTRTASKESEVKVVREGESADFVIDNLEVDLHKDLALFCTLVEVDMKKDGSFAIDHINKLAKQGIDYIEKKVEEKAVEIKDGVIPGPWWAKLAEYVLRSLFEAFKHLAQDDLIGEEAIKLSKDFKSKKFTSVYQSPKGQSFLDFKYTVKYQIEVH